MMQGTPILILREGTERDKGRGASATNIAAARAIADAVRSTLGPRGMDKMLVDSMGDITITNDGVTILKEVNVEHPAAKMLVEVAKTQDQQCGDGTTTAVVLAGELLKRATTRSNRTSIRPSSPRDSRSPSGKPSGSSRRISEPRSRRRMRPS